MTTNAAETWLFDLGNSRVKLARLERAAPCAIEAVDWNQGDFSDALRGVLGAWPRPGRVLVASVASAARAAALREALPADASDNVEWLRTPRRACGVGNRYARPERLGIDRFLAMVAIHARASGPAIAIGCGTAMTLDAVAADGAHAAGLIALSPQRMLAALRGETAIADTNPVAFDDGADDDTAAALRSGCWASAGALAEWFAARQATGAERTPIWLHGGWAERLATWLANDGLSVEVFDHAVLHGLAVWADSLSR